MRLRRPSPLPAGLVLALLPLLAAAQSIAPPTPNPQQPATPASSPVVKPTPRTVRPADLPDPTALPNDSMPSKQVLPQVAIPIGRGANDHDPQRASPRPVPPGPTGGIDDTAARCLARGDWQSSACRH